MQVTKSIRFRIIIACIFFAIVINIGYGLVTLIGLKINDDELFNWHIAREAESILKQYKSKNKIDINSSTSVKTIISDEKKAIRLLLSFFNHPENSNNPPEYLDFSELNMKGSSNITAQGFHIYEFNKDSLSIHVLKANLNRKDNHSLYYMVDISQFNKHDNTSAAKVTTMFWIIFSLTSFLGVILAFFLANRVVSPLTTLINSIEETNEKKSFIDSSKYYNDEIGFLAKTIDSYIDRTNAFIEREKSFSRDASHELRTPIANISAALELLDTLPESNNSKLEILFSRISRANKDMNHLVETFLLLGKEHETKLDHKQTNLHSIVNISIDKNSYLKKTSEIKLINDINRNALFSGPEQHLTIVIDNIIRNALQNTYKGFVKVTENKNTIIIQDSGVGFDLDNLDKSTSGSLDRYGIGLSIVKKICTQYDWEIRIESKIGKGTIFYLFL